MLQGELILWDYRQGIFKGHIDRVYRQGDVVRGCVTFDLFSIRDSNQDDIWYIDRGMLLEGVLPLTCFPSGIAIKMMFDALGATEPD